MYPNVADLEVDTLVFRFNSEIPDFVWRKSFSADVYGCVLHIGTPVRDVIYFYEEKKKI